MTDDLVFVLPDGRALSYATLGVPAGTEDATDFYFHGTPGSHYEGRGWHEAACRQGLRIVAITRPGFGGSTAQPGRSLLSFSADVLALADHLAIQRFVVLGISGGGPYELACVHAMPPTRLVGAVVVAGMYPIELGTNGMMLSNRLLFTLIPWVPRLMAFTMDWLMAGRLARDDAHPEWFAQEMKKLLRSSPAEDQAALDADDGRIQDILIQSSREGLRRGSQAAVGEMNLFASDWGFKLTEIKMENGELVLWHGNNDINIPVAMAEKAASLIQGAELRVERDEAHLSLPARKMDKILAALAKSLRTAQSEQLVEHRDPG